MVWWGTVSPMAPKGGQDTRHAGATAGWRQEWAPRTGSGGPTAGRQGQSGPIPGPGDQKWAGQVESGRSLEAWGRVCLLRLD